MDQVSLLRHSDYPIHIAHADLNIRYMKSVGFSRSTFTQSDLNGNKAFILHGTFWPKNTSLSLRLWMDAYANWALENIKRIQPSLIHAHTYLGAAISQKINQKYKIPYVVTAHYSGWLDGTIRPSHKKAGIKGFLGAHQVVSVSSALQHSLRDIGISSKVIPNFIDEGLFVPPENPRSTNPFTIIGVGDLIPRKQWNLLIEAFLAVQKDIPNVILKLIGDGPERENLELFCTRVGASDNIHFTGQLDKTEMVQEYQMANVLIHTSRHETFGIVYLEAMNSGLPVISFANDVSSDLLKGIQHGYLVEMNNVKSLSQKLIELYQNYHQLDFSTIRSAIQSKYSTSEAVQLYGYLYEDCLSTY